MRTWLLLLAALGATSCSDTEELPPYLAANTYAGQHRAEVEYNCSQAHACAQMMMVDVTEQAFDMCVAMSATSLNATDPISQLTWLVKVNRCQSPDACRYNTCVTQGGAGFGEVQIAKVTHSCDARTQCAMQTGMPIGDPTRYRNDCLLQRILQLDTYSTDAQAAYQDAYWPCASLQACQFTACFPY